MKRRGEQPAEEQAATFLARAKEFDFNSTDVTIAATIAGLGLAAVAVYLANKKLGNSVSTADGEAIRVANSPTEYMRGIVSFVRRDGSAASFPATDEAAARLGGVNDPGLFLMEDGDMVRSPEGDKRYLRAARWAIGIAQQVLSPQAAEAPIEPEPDV